MICTGDTDADGFADTASDVLLLSCGCSSTPSPAPTPVLFVNSSTPPPLVSSTGACADGDSFSIESESMPITEGCYLDTSEANNGSPVYTISGIMDVGQIWVVAVEVELDETSSIVSGNIHVPLLTGWEAGHGRTSSKTRASRLKDTVRERVDLDKWLTWTGDEFGATACGQAYVSVRVGPFLWGELSRRKRYHPRTYSGKTMHSIQTRGTFPWVTNE